MCDARHNSPPLPVGTPDFTRAAADQPRPTELQLAVALAVAEALRVHPDNRGTKRLAAALGRDPVEGDVGKRQRDS